ncbi:uncharacterized protein GIQ15_00753 [Arthroderma uncinatum]|uniref:uncharacterized protein n=1 Tax=Arthroderma uncinatum TaxID=74035 RepID=UPI00144AA086|nr:uncharacterized protein GIQ15_00753 [Arthroderma uncinatum]KAF3491236.1 hypothetical protein GIQ15_00753 [Arthroderma uncinatum]
MTSSSQTPLWVSPDAGNYPIDQYRLQVNKKFNVNLQNSHQLQQWSVKRPHDFWIDLYKYIGLVPELPPNITRAYDDSLPLNSIPPFFENVQLNYTENILKGKDPNAIALIGLRESDPLDGEPVTWAQLNERIRVVRSALLQHGIKQGDRVGAIVSTSIWSVVLLLASASIGAVFSSISPDMGIEDPCFLLRWWDSTLEKLCEVALVSSISLSHQRRIRHSLIDVLILCRLIMAARKAFALPELVHLIVEHAEYYERRPLLTVSRLFQVAVEQSAWRGYTFRTDSSIEDFLEKYHSHRSRYLRSIDIHIDFPTQISTDENDFPTQISTDENELPCRVTAKDLQSYNELFTRQISALFTMIKTLEERELPHNQPRNIHLRLRAPYHHHNNHKDCHHRKYLSWRLCLLTHKNLPTLSSVNSLSVGEHGVGKGDTRIGVPSTSQSLDYGVLPALVSKLPNLVALDCQWLREEWPLAYEYPVLTHFSRPWEGPWRDARHAFGSIMQNAATLPAKMERVKILSGLRYAFGSHDETLPLPNLISLLSYDPFSSGLRIISQRVVDLNIHACIDRNLFWPLPNEDKAKSPFWPYLKYLHVEFQPMSPSGTWYFQGPRGEGRDTTTFEVTEAHYPPVKENPEDEHWDEVWDEEGGHWEDFGSNMFRIVPVDEVIEPFLETFVKALGRMPLLEKAELFTCMRFCPGEDIEKNYPESDYGKEYMWGLRYLLPKDGSHPFLEWHVVQRSMPYPKDPNAEIEDTLCVRRRRKDDKDEEVFLFIKMRNQKEKTLTPELQQRLRLAIRTSLSPRHVPRFILQVPEIPVTINGKKVEIAVKKIISGNKCKSALQW